MFEKTKETFTTLGVLLRILATLRSISKSLASLADSQTLALKLSVLQSGGSIEELRTSTGPSDEDTIDDDFDTDDTDLAEYEKIEIAAKNRGRELDDNEDPGAAHLAWLNVESDEKRNLR